MLAAVLPIASSGCRRTAKPVDDVRSFQHSRPKAGLPSREGMPAVSHSPGLSERFRQFERFPYRTQAKQLVRLANAGQAGLRTNAGEGWRRSVTMLKRCSLSPRLRVPHISASPRQPSARKTRRVSCRTRNVDLLSWNHGNAKSEDGEPMPGRCCSRIDDEQDFPRPSQHPPRITRPVNWPCVVTSGSTPPGRVS